MLDQEHKDLDSVIYSDQDNSERCYLLGQEICFIPNKNILYNIKNRKNITIFSPASKILDFLIIKRGSTVSQRELIQVGWGDKSELVSMNTYYQCMLKLRRAFIEIGHNDEIVKTVTRKGVQLVSDVVINYDYDIDSLIASDTPDNDETEESTHTSKTRPLYSFRLVAFSLAIIFVLLALFSIFFHMSSSTEKPKENYFSLYKLHETTKNNCKIFTNINNSKQNISSIYTSGINCSAYPYVYITEHHSRPRTSIFYCSDNVTKNGVCFSRFYTDGISQ
ncbi:hypothetical protein GIX45_07815 [Erwinia sp. CPCC 100877]|nr:hypothetical protein [Erwinia sp. CPCC 100877]